MEICDPCCRRLGCSCKDHDGEPIASIENKRSCTDIPCIGLFGIFIIFLVSYVWITAYSEGDPDRLIRGVNYRGLICGKSSDVVNLPYAFWPDTTSIRFKVCTNSCNATLNANGNHIAANGFSGVPYESSLYLDKYCLPSSSSISISGFDDYSNRFQRYMGDVETAIPIIGASIAIAFIISFLYIWLMKCCVGILVWGTIIIILIGGCLCGYVLIDKSQDDNLSSSDSDFRKYAGYTFFILTGIFFLIILFSRNRIRIAIQVIKSAGRAIGDMPMMVFFPFWPLFSIIGFFFAWMYGSIYIFSAGDMTTSDTPSTIGSRQTFDAENNAFTTESTFKVIDYDDTIQNAFAPHFLNHHQQTFVQFLYLLFHQLKNIKIQYQLQYHIQLKIIKKLQLK